MKVEILKNVKYKKESYRIGEVIKVDKDDIDEFIEKEVVDAAEIEVTEESQEVVKNDTTEEPTTEGSEGAKVIDYTPMTKMEIGGLLSEKGIDYNSRDSKDKLIELLLGSD